MAVVWLVQPLAGPQWPRCRVYPRSPAGQDGEKDPQSGPGLPGQQLRRRLGSLGVPPLAENSEIDGDMPTCSCSKCGQDGRRGLRRPRNGAAVHTRQELGADPDDLPSPVLAGAASAAFSFGALVAAAALPGVDPGRCHSHHRDRAMAGEMVVGQLTGRAHRTVRVTGDGYGRPW